MYPKDPQGRIGTDVQNVVGMLLEIGGFAPKFLEYYWNIVGIFANAALGSLGVHAWGTWLPSMTWVPLQVHARGSTPFTGPC